MNIIDFTKMERTLFVGVRSGLTDSSSYAFDEKKVFKIKTREEQLVTSSYWVGFLQVQLGKVSKPPRTLTEALSLFDLTEFKGRNSRNELTRALKRMFVIGLIAH